MNHKTPNPELISPRGAHWFVAALGLAAIPSIIALLLSWQLVRDARADTSEANRKLDELGAQNTEDRRVTDCIRKLASNVSTAERRADTAETDLVVALGAGGSRGGIDMAAIFAEIAAANEHYKTVDEAYNRAVNEGVDLTRDCPDL